LLAEPTETAIALELLDKLVQPEQLVQPHVELAELVVQVLVVVLHVAVLHVAVLPFAAQRVLPAVLPDAAQREPFFVAQLVSAQPVRSVQPLSVVLAQIVGL
jgi:hypothetical protein